MSMQGLKSVFKSSVAYLSPIRLNSHQKSTDDLTKEHYLRLEQITQVLNEKRRYLALNEKSKKGTKF